MNYIVILFFLGSIPTIASALKPNLTEQQKLFIEAEKAIKAKNWRKLEQLEAKLSDYPLLPYIHRDRLLQTLDKSKNSAITDFLEQHRDSPVAKKLRYKWLQKLAQKNYSSLFLRHYKDFGSLRLNCKQLEYRYRTSENRQDLNGEISQIWLVGRSLPKACDKLIGMWKKAGELNDSLIWQRMLLAVKAREGKLVSYLNRQLPVSQQQAGQLLLDVYRKPTKLATTHFKAPLTDRAKDIVSLGLNKLAWEDPNKAIQIWEKIGQQHPIVGEFTSIKRAISLSLAIDKDPKAGLWLGSLNMQRDESVSQWLLSTAIHQQDWQQIANVANRLSFSGHEEQKWRYWQAISHTQLGNLDKAQALFQSIADNRSYYGFLAARQLNIQPQLQHQTISYSEPELTHLARHPAAQRAKEFFTMGRLPDARREWNHLVARANQQDHTKLALIAHQWGWQHQAILAFARSKQINDVQKRFPLHHYQTYAQQAKRNQIPISWAYAITRQESAFKTDAVSSAGARGLMQLRPSTARQVAKKRLNYKRASQLLVADTNIKLGTAHLSDMFNSFNDHPILATAAYNAGKTRVKEWLEKSNTRDAIQWIEQIPYKETREYVKNVLTYQLIYAKLTDQTDSFISQIDNFPILNQSTALTGR